MRAFRNAEDVLQADVEALIVGAEEPVALVRQMIREADGCIVEQRATLSAHARAAGHLRKRLAARQEEIERQHRLAEAAVDDDRDDDARDALARKRDLQEALGELEAAWWEEERIRDEADRRLQQLEDRAQHLRQRKDALVGKRQRDRSSSDFIAVPPNIAGEGEPPDPDLERELGRLRNGGGRDGP
jgi:phage shock protein A